MRRITAALALLALIGCEQGPPTVTVAGERLVGKYVEDGEVAAFLGIPFAQPPVGALRWRKPLPIATQVDSRVVTTFAPACMQTMRILDWYRYMAELFGGSADYYDDLEISEDCLYLNIWTPTLETDAELPVMIWIHGGSNKSGWSYELNYHGNKLAQEGVVVVSVAYRQGVFGFFADAGMDPDDGLANFAYWDLIAALEWVQKHIRQFGGDPDRVTLFGESAGAQNIVALMFAEPAQGLFHRAIAQSLPRLGIDGPQTLDETRMRASRLAEIFGLEPGDTDSLRRIPADELLAEYAQEFAGYYHVATVDEQIFSATAWERLVAGDIPAMPLLIGTNDHENYDSVPNGTTWEDLAAQARELKRIDGEKGLAIVRKESDPRRAADRLMTAEHYLCKSQLTAAAITAAGGDAWVYHFTRVREDEAAARELGAYHGAEYPYLFGIHDAYMTTNEIDLALEEIMQRYWVGFAASGDPNSPNTPQWPRYAGPDFRVQELGDSVRTKPAPEPELCALFGEGLRAR